MTMFKAGLAAAAIFIGAVLALMGLTVLVSSLGSDAILFTHGVDGQAVSEKVTRAAEPERFWKLVGMLGMAPLVLGGFAALWGTKTLRR